MRLDHFRDAVRFVDDLHQLLRLVLADQCYELLVLNHASGEAQLVASDVRRPVKRCHVFRDLFEAPLFSHHDLLFLAERGHLVRGLLLVLEDELSLVVDSLDLKVDGVSGVQVWREWMVDHDLLLRHLRLDERRPVQHLP